MNNVIDLRKSRLTIPGTSVLFQNKIWSIELLKCRAEIAVTNGYNVYYAYYDKAKNLLRWDNPYPVPRYIQSEALKQAVKSNMISIY